MSEAMGTYEEQLEAAIKPCPKCGGKPVLEGTWGDEIVCNGCGLWSGEDHGDLGEAIEWWNKQPRIDELAAAQARIAQLEVQFETARAGQRHGQARIAEIEAQLAERGEYVPVDVAFIRCDDGHYLQVEQQTVAVGPYGKHSVTAFDLPEPYYICRRVQREDDSL